MSIGGFFEGFQGWETEKRITSVKKKTNPQGELKIPWFPRWPQPSLLLPLPLSPAPQPWDSCHSLAIVSNSLFLRSSPISIPGIIPLCEEEAGRVGSPSYLLHPQPPTPPLHTFSLPPQDGKKCLPSFLVVDVGGWVTLATAGCCPAFPIFKTQSSSFW